MSEPAFFKLDAPASLLERFNQLFDLEHLNRALLQVFMIGAATGRISSKVADARQAKNVIGDIAAPSKILSAMIGS